eukprot:g1670.t1
MAKWDKVYDDASGYYYYYNSETGESTWDEPEDFVSPEAKSTTIKKEPTAVIVEKKIQEREQKLIREAKLQKERKEAKLKNADRKEREVELKSSKGEKVNEEKKKEAESVEETRVSLNMGGDTLVFSDAQNLEIIYANEKCAHCKKIGHVAIICPELKDKECSYCLAVGHTYVYCPKKLGFEQRQREAEERIRKKEREEWERKQKSIREARLAVAKFEREAMHKAEMEQCAHKDHFWGIDYRLEQERLERERRNKVGGVYTTLRNMLRKLIRKRAAKKAHENKLRTEEENQIREKIRMQEEERLQRKHGDRFWGVDKYNAERLAEYNDQIRLLRTFEKACGKFNQGRKEILRNINKIPKKVKKKEKRHRRLYFRDFDRSYNRNEISGYKWNSKNPIREKTWQELQYEYFYNVGRIKPTSRSEVGGSARHPSPLLEKNPYRERSFCPYTLTPTSKYKRKIQLKKIKDPPLFRVAKIARDTYGGAKSIVSLSQNNTPNPTKILTSSKSVGNYRRKRPQSALPVRMQSRFSSTSERKTRPKSAFTARRRTSKSSPLATVKSPIRRPKSAVKFTDGIQEQLRLRPKSRGYYQNILDELVTRDEENKSIILDSFRNAHENCIVGAGPGGLQLAELMADNGDDFALLERNDQGGSFFSKFPKHGSLISINKRSTGRGKPGFNERHDWNSLMTSNSSLQFTNYTEDYYPKSALYSKYLSDVAASIQQKIEGTTSEILFNSPVSKVSRSFWGKDFKVTIPSQTLSCGNLIWAAGLAPKDVPSGFEDYTASSKKHGINGDYDKAWAEGYRDVDVSHKRYFNETVLVVGGGNAGWETAKALQNAAANVVMYIKSDIRFSYETHYVADVRSINIPFIDGYLLKSLDFIYQLQFPLDDKNFNIGLTDSPDGSRPKISIHPKVVPKSDTQEVVSDAFNTDYGMTANAGETYITLPSNEVVPTLPSEYDRIIFCHGFAFDPQDIFDDDVKAKVGNGRLKKFPVVNANYESVNVPNLFFAGALAHGRDFKRSAGGFVHGYRYTARALYNILQVRKNGAEGWPMTKYSSVQGVMKRVRDRIDSMAGPYQMFSELCDVVVLPKLGSGKEERKAKYFQEIPLDYVPQFVLKELQEEQFVTICLDYNHESKYKVLEKGYIGDPYDGAQFALGVKRSDMWGQGKKNIRVRRPARADNIGSVGPGLLSNFLHPILSYYDLSAAKSYGKVSVDTMRKYQISDTVLYPVSSYHAFEDIDTDWRKVAHTVPMNWWLSDMIEPHLDPTIQKKFYSPNEVWDKSVDADLLEELIDGEEIHVEIVSEDYRVARDILWSSHHMGSDILSDIDPEQKHNVYYERFRKLKDRKGKVLEKMNQKQRRRADQKYTKPNIFRIPHIDGKESMTLGHELSQPELFAEVDVGGSTF